ncbi:TPA: topoisomerase, partial [Streptococcus suis]
MMDTKTVEQARNTDMIAFFERRCGFTFAHRGGVYRCEQHQSLAVKNDRLSWYWHSKGIGGHGALDYLMKVEHMPFRQAVEAI